MKIKRFNESTDTFIPMKIENPRIYYKIYVDNSIRKFEVALDKLGLKQSFYRYFDFDIKKFENQITSNKEIFLIIDFNKNTYGFTIVNSVPNPGSNFMKDRINGGEVFVSEQELATNKYNLI